MLVPSRNGTRLVAVQLDSSRPRIAWTTGSAERYQYHFKTTSGEVLSSFEAIDSPPDASLLKNHEFLAAPISVAEDLFIMSAADERIWLNCLERSAGSVRWQIPLAADDPVSQASVLMGDTVVPSEARICVSAENLIICSLFRRAC